LWHGFQLEICPMNNSGLILFQQKCIDFPVKEKAHPSSPEEYAFVFHGLIIPEYHPVFNY
ncbi:MAG: hypothetical protein Q4B85_13945, partial [Lachnospiraceae bacterium]|nr:hypothetical protein [Lachnospiraceae bacterium]